MKKRFFSLFMIFLLLLLCGCADEAQGSSNQQNGQTDSASQNSSEGETDSGETGLDYALMVQVTINPEFSLYLDSEMTILSAEAANEDAEALFAQLDVSGKPYAEGMVQVLNAAYDLGYLTDGGQISIAVASEAYTGTLEESLLAPVSQFETDKAVSVSGYLEAIMEEIPDFSANYLGGFQRIQQGDQTIWLSKDTFALGEEKVTMYSFYNKYPNPMIYTDGILIGSSVDAIRIKVITVRDSLVSVSYFQDGKIVKETSSYADGTYEVREYVGGGIIRETRKNADGTTSITDNLFTYHENGNIKTMEIWWDGGYSVATYSESGLPVYSTGMRSDGSQWEDTYDDNGNLSTHEEHFPNGDYYIETFYENGACATYQYETEGYSIIQHFNPDGSYQYHYDNGDGGREFWFSDGKIVKAVVAGVTYTDAESLRNYAAGLGITQ